MTKQEFIKWIEQNVRDNEEITSRPSQSYWVCGGDGIYLYTEYIIKVCASVSVKEDWVIN